MFLLRVGLEFDLCIDLNEVLIGTVMDSGRYSQIYRVSTVTVCNGSVCDCG